MNIDDISSWKISVKFIQDLHINMTDFKQEELTQTTNLLFLLLPLFKYFSYNTFKKEKRKIK